MKITILSMFPEMFGSFLASPITKRAMDRGIAQIRLIDIKDYAGGSFRHIDDSTFGGGAGMVLRAQPVLDALKEALHDDKSLSSDSHKACAAGEFTETSPAEGFPKANAAEEYAGTGATSGISKLGAYKPFSSDMDKAGAAAGTMQHQSVCISALTPVGRLYDQKTAERYAGLDHLILLCGHYEGMDERVYSHVDERISIGDYILSGGETAAMVVMDSILRLLPGVLRAESTENESFSEDLGGLLEYPQYTRPAVLDDAHGGDRVPEVLLSGNHEEIRKWRLEKSVEATLHWRPELLDSAGQISRQSAEENGLPKAPGDINLPTD